jgi:multidrug resistance efflux pump
MILPTEQRPVAPPRIAPGEFQLPDLPQSQWFGARVIRRAITLILGILLTLAAGTALVLAFFRADVTVEGVGVLEPVRVWPVRSREVGLVADLLVRSGDTVRAGQPLVKLDSLLVAGEIEKLRLQERSLRAALAQARAAYPAERRQGESARSQAESNRLRARAALRDELSRFEIAGSPDSVMRSYTPGTHISIDRALADVMGADAELRAADARTELAGVKRFDLAQREAQIEEASAQRRLAEARLGRLVVRAPAAGVVKTDRLERLVGAPVAAGDLLMEITEPRDWAVDLRVSEQKVYEVHVGDPVKVEIGAFRANQRERIAGRVASIAAEPVPAEGEAGGVAYRVRVRLAPDDVERIGRGRLRAGYLVEGKIVTGNGRLGELLWRYVRGSR